VGRTTLAAARRGLSGHRIALALWLGSGLTAVAWLVWNAQGVVVQVQRKPWSRDIEIERQVDVTSSGWCAQLPEGARVVDRRRLNAPDSGQDAEHCRYATPEWRAVYSLHAAGAGPVPAPYWPAIAHASDERPGRRHERYEVELADARGRSWTCKLDQARWTRLPTDATLRLKVDRFGVADCGSLAPH
jgi:hypothetical protein